MRKGVEPGAGVRGNEICGKTLVLTRMNTTCSSHVLKMGDEPCGSVKNVKNLLQVRESRPLFIYSMTFD